MALLSSMYCPQCKKDTEVMVGAGQPTPDICNECDAKNEANAKDTHLRNLTELSLETRIENIEEWIYDQGKKGGCNCDMHTPL